MKHHLRFKRPDPDTLVGAYRSVCPDAKRVGSEWTGPCPVCGGDDRFWINMRTGSLGCRGCSPGRKNPKAYQRVLRALGLGGKPAIQHQRILTAREKADKHDRRRRIHAAQQLWHHAGTAAGTPVETYLVMHRTVWPGDRPLPDSIRWLPRSSMGRTGRGMPQGAVGVMICAYTTVEAHLNAVSMEALRQNGMRPGNRWRRTFGVRRGAGALFRIGQPTDMSVHVAEGEVSAIAVAGRRIIRCVVATGGSWALRDLPQWALPMGTARVMLHVDGDRAGEDAALAVARPLMAAGIAVGFARYPPGRDAADSCPAKVYWPSHWKRTDIN